MRIGNPKHGMRYTSTYNSWRRIIQRCTNRKQPHWSNYGGRGIGFDPRWKEFKNFLADMGEKPSDEYSIERVDNDRDYCKANCRWATDKEQRRNKRTNRNITLGGVTMCVADWSVKTGINLTTLYGRLNRGWSDEKTLTTPLKKKP